MFDRKPGSGNSAEGQTYRVPTLSRRQRITDSRVFREAFEQGRAFPGRFLVLRIRRGEGAALRLGVVASKRTLRRAVDRVRARRLMREAFRLNRAMFRGDCDVVLIARYLIRTATRQEVEGDLLKVARRAGLLVGERRRDS